MSRLSWRLPLERARRDDFLFYNNMKDQQIKMFCNWLILKNENLR